ncbi:MAG: phytoene/squalene synthetase [Oscillatoriales cyanobacterium]|nr:MAG: phytoene/squalene synthetase [Oscillatoriales cyanobacterium]
MIELSSCRELLVTALSGFRPKLQHLILGFGSSHGHAISDDALKDADNAAWLVYLTPEIRAVWSTRIHWIRTVDRLAEQAWLNGRRQEFEQFRHSWQHLKMTGDLPIEAPYRQELGQMFHLWQAEIDTAPCDRDPCHSFALSAWERYLEAVTTYHRDDLVIATMTDYDRLIDRLGGSLFQVFPDLNVELAAGARAFGALDQCYNHLRDLDEDTQHRLCYFPQRVLQRFGLSAEDFYQRTVFERSGYIDLMHYWLSDYLPPRKAIAQQFAQRLDLSPAWRLLCDWSLDRYQRIETCLRHCNYNYVDFTQQYWADVRQQLHPHSRSSVHHISAWTRLTRNSA